MPYVTTAELLAVVGFAADLCTNDDTSSNPACEYINVFQEQFEGVSAYIQQLVADLQVTFDVICWSFLIAVGAGFLYLYLMRYCAFCIVVTGMVGLVVGLGFCIYVLYDYYNDLKEKVGIEPQIATYEQDKRNMNITLALGIIASVLEIIVVFIVVFMFKQIRVACILLSLTAEALVQFIYLILYPLVNVALLIVGFILWLVGAAWLATAGDVTVDPTYGIGEMSYDDTMKKAFLYWLFGGLWLQEMITAMGFMVIAFTFTIWFFSPLRDLDGDGEVESHERIVPFCTIGRSLKLTLTHHVGTLALGSLIIAIINFIRLIIEYFEQKMKSYNGGEIPKIWKLIFCCLKCCLWCLEKCMKYINKNTYIQTCINGTWFCVSMCNAFKCLLGYINYIFVTSAISTAMLAFGKVAIALATGGIGGWWIMTYRYDDVSSIVPSCIVIVAIGFGIATMFCEVYAMGIDTMLMCFCEAKRQGIEDVPLQLARFVDAEKKKYEDGEEEKKKAREEKEKLMAQDTAPGVAPDE